MIEKAMLKLGLNNGGQLNSSPYIIENRFIGE
jgi:hypothetical protein